ncbi:helix-turn-helix domain-containing protein [Rhizobium beringeri]
MTLKTPPSVRQPAWNDCARIERDQRREHHEEIRRLHRAGMSPRQIAPRLGLSVRTVERWLAVGGGRSIDGRKHRRPPLSLSDNIWKNDGREVSTTVHSYGRRSSGWASGVVGRRFTDGPPTAREQPNSTPEPAVDVRHRAGNARGSSASAPSRSTNVPVVTFVIFMNMRQSLK